MCGAHGKKNTPWGSISNNDHYERVFNDIKVDEEEWINFQRDRFGWDESIKSENGISIHEISVRLREWTVSQMPEGSERREIYDKFLEAFGEIVGKLIELDVRPRLPRYSHNEPYMGHYRGRLTYFSVQSEKWAEFQEIRFRRILMEAEGEWTRVGFDAVYRSIDDWTRTEIPEGSSRRVIHNKFSEVFGETIGKLMALQIRSALPAFRD
ncbi:hypothetical protein [Shimazuella kribbensis]|uniref:hypothetical protein n=1 Tax=Shimazuella kribbensis TaxID=139808 RepID=UPI0004268259|nr:hypothetical protein [Shimazuella kribbensis]